MAKTNKRKQQYENIQSGAAKTGGEYDSFMNQFLGRPTGTTPGYTPTYVNTGGNNTSGKTGLFGAASGLLNRGHQPDTGQTGGTPANNDLSSPEYARLKAAGADERGYLTSGLKGFSESGGISPEDIASMRATYGNIGGPANVNLSDFAKEKEGYGNLIDTGGYSGADIQRVRAQAASSAPSLFNALKSQQQLAQSRMGGANAGANAGFDFKNARAAAQQGASDRLGANIGLAESIRAGKQTGLAGLTGIDTTTGEQSLSKAGLENQFNIGKAGIGSDVESRIAQMQQSGKEFGLSGLQGLYGQDYAPQKNFENTWLNAIGASGDAARASQGLNLNNDEVNRSKLAENIIGGIGAAAGGLTGLGGISSIGKMFGGAAKTGANIGASAPNFLANTGASFMPGYNPSYQSPFANPYQRVNFGGGR